MNFLNKLLAINLNYQVITRLELTLTSHFGYMNWKYWSEAKNLMN